jgi:hypothetical protein
MCLLLSLRGYLHDDVKLKAGSQPKLLSVLVGRTAHGCSWKPDAAVQQAVQSPNASRTALPICQMLSAQPPADTSPAP